MKDATRPRETAADAYAAHGRRVGALLGWIEGELEAHADRHRAAPGNWGLVGDLAALEPLLRWALGHLSGIEEQGIEQALADAGEAKGE